MPEYVSRNTGREVLERTTQIRITGSMDLLFVPQWDEIPKVNDSDF